MSDNSIVIVNPNSKGGQTGKNWESIEQILVKYFGNDLKIVFTEKAGDGIVLARKHLHKGSTQIIPIGGDGIINEVTNGFFKENINRNIDSVDFKDIKHDDLLSVTNVEPINPDAILTILPGGTRNVLIRSLGLSPDFDDCCKNLSESKNFKKIDVIAALVMANNEKDSRPEFRLFLNAAEIGLGAEIIDKSKLVRDQISSRLLSTVTGILATLPTYKSNVCEIIEGSLESKSTSNRLLTKMTMGMVSNGSYLGGGFQVATKADVTDGLLDTIVIKNSDSFKILHKLINIKKGEEAISNENDIYYSQSQIVKWITEIQNNITVSVDGEPIGILPGLFRIHPQNLTIRL
ncbi:diacylglycerol/lipid kinase family protein [Candidatus Nitrosocosmicus arcticus]|uniref:Putative diacylglycerol kinase catalytic region n=1 Tax=Candidatus Nitrosocosmicus arcticus TaxID=2035267 RepID=A0A557SVM3_9ARCH|nr:diacylglycerol kinase family protein [Candidatus Nitrosocosmicus arcticus]TVP40658.1 putative diacylglycerol kinase catalytic region [Candidatus Nitrosocosmicus arcticus]